MSPARDYRAENFKRRYGLTVEDYEHQARLQSYRCAICYHKRPLYVDHDHSTGLVRGLLCDRCNLGLGHFADDPKRLTSAIDYLRRSHHGQGQ